MSAIVATQDLKAGYRKRRVLDGISLQVGSGEIVLLIGPNGCGKTTLMKVLGGVLKPEGGQVFLHGSDVTHVIGYRRARMGLGYLTQGRNTFPSLTVNENLKLSFWRQRGDFDQRKESVLELFPILKPILGRRAGLLSGGEGQALAIGMVLMRPVDILLLDEPSAGLSPAATDGIMAAIRKAQSSSKFAAIIVEHNLSLVHHWVSRVLVMAQGRIVMEERNPPALLSSEKLHERYFG